MDNSAHALTLLCEGPDTTLYRAAQPGSAPVLMLIATTNSRDVANRMEAELSIADRLTTPWALRPIETTTHLGRPALLLDDPGGYALTTWILNRHSIGEFLITAISIARAVAKAHGRQFVHLDLRPSNVLVDAAGAARLTGFGFANPHQRAEAGGTTVLTGNYEYMSPEQSGRTDLTADHRSDLYALGAIFYEMLTGAIPFRAEDAAGWFQSHAVLQPVPPSVLRGEIPGVLSDIVLKLLSKSPEDRYQSATGLERDLCLCEDEWRRTSYIEPFDLAQHDTIETIARPKCLYGRAAELEKLGATFKEVVSDGTARICLIGGCSGVGKTSLVNDFLRKMSMADAMVAVGKFDQFRPDIPFATLTQAFAGVIDRLLQLDEIELRGWREAILDAVSPYGQLMVNLIPRLELVIGEQPAVADASPWDQEARFKRVVHKFVKVLARDGVPLVLFLDDLQWLDGATLKLLRGLLGDPDVVNLMVLGAFRNDEITPGLAEFLSSLGDMASKVRELSLKPLGTHDLEALVGEAVGVRLNHAPDLAALIFEKTAGNPFHALQFLRSIADNGLLSFDQASSRWQWEPQHIRGEAVTDNVATMLAARLGRLTEDTRQALSALASLGSLSTLRNLASVLRRNEGDCRAILSSGIEGGIVAERGGVYTFLHDRLQEAAYDLVPADERVEIHMTIGRALLSSCSQVEIEENIFAVVGQFNLGLPFLKSSDEMVEVARLNLLAAQKAKFSAAYQSALTYTEAGLAVLKGREWHEEYELTFELSVLRMECELARGGLDRIAALLDEIRPHCETKSGLARLCCLESDIHVMRSDYVGAIEVATKGLRLLNIDFPMAPTRQDVDEAFEEVWRALGDRDVGSLVEMPRMTDRDVEAAMRVLQALFTPAGLHNSNMLYLVLCKMVELTLRFGTTPASPIGLVWFGMSLAHVFGRYREGLEFGHLAIAIVGRHRFEAERAKTLFCLQMLMVWTRPVSEGLEIVRRAYTAALSSGDIITACFSAVHIVADRLLRGDHLDAVLSEVEETLSFARNSQYRDVIDCIRVQARFVRVMKGDAASFSSFDGDDFDTASFESEFTPDRMPMMTFFYWTSKGMSKYLSGDYEEAAVSLRLAEALIPRSSGHIQRADIVFFAALTDAVLADVGNVAAKAFIAKISGRLPELETWAAISPDTFADRPILVQAELARLEGRHIEAMSLYDEAISLAHRNGFVHNEAIAAEVASRYHFARGSKITAEAYLARARACFNAWGAVGKVRQLDGLYLQAYTSSQPVAFAAPSQDGFERLDRSTIIRVSQALSSEIDLEKVIETLMGIALKDSGGERAVLVLTGDNELRIEAEGSLADGSMSVRFPDRPVTKLDVPESLVRFVMRSGTSILLNDAAEENAYANDIYFRDGGHRSVLCVPLVKYQKTMGALFIENNQLPRAFSSERLDILRLVSQQAGTSLENARLFRDIQKVTGASMRAEIEHRNSIDLIPAMVWTVFSSGKGALFNKQWYAHTGISPEVAEEGGWIYSFHEDDRAKVLDKWQTINDLGISGEVEARLLDRNGGSRWFLVRASPLMDENGSIVKWYGTNTDIDDLKRSEQLVLEEKRLLEIVGKGHSLASIVDEVAVVAERFLTESICVVFLLDPETNQLVQCNAPALSPDFPKMVLDSVRAVIPNPWQDWARSNATAMSVNLERDLPRLCYEQITTAHELRACWSTPILSFDRKVLGRFAVHFEAAREIQPLERKIAEQLVRLTGIVVERKQSEDALRQSETLLAEGEMMSHAGSWTWLSATGRVSWSAECARIFGHDPEERDLPYDALLERIHPIDKPLLESRRVPHGDRPHSDDFEFRIIRPDGTERIVQARDKLTYDRSANVSAYFVTVLDVTERRRRDEEVRRLASLIENSNECIAYGKTLHDVVYVNDAWRRTVGLPAATDLASACMNDFMTDEEVDAVTSKILPALEWDGHWEGESALRRVDTQEVVPVYKTVFFIVDSVSGHQKGVATICRDITEQKRMNISLQTSLSEKEALLKEVHHRVKNNLQLISSLLSLQADRIADPRVAELFAESRDRVRSMALVHENLYRAGNFASISIQLHIETLCANLMHANAAKGQDIELLTDVDDMELDIDKAVPIGLIVNELVSNSLKHAFPDRRRGQVVVRLSRVRAGECVLSVSDDGVGLPLGFESDRAETLGLQLVRDLTDQLHGVIEPSSDGGASFKIRFFA